MHTVNLKIKQKLTFFLILVKFKAEENKVFPSYKWKRIPLVISKRYDVVSQFNLLKDKQSEQQTTGVNSFRNMRPALNQEKTLVESREGTEEDILFLIYILNIDTFSF